MWLFLAYYCCHGKSTVLSLCIVVVVNSIKAFSLDMELRHCYRAAKCGVFVEAIGR